MINGAWNTTTATDESWQFWAHVRLANLAAGPTTWAGTSVADPYVPKNAVGGQLGISSMSTTPTNQVQITGMSGTYQICSAGILGKFAKQLDIQMDDGNTQTGSLRVVPDGSAIPTAAPLMSTIDDASSYTVCMTF